MIKSVSKNVIIIWVFSFVCAYTVFGQNKNDFSKTKPAFSAEYEDGPHDMALNEFEGWYYYGYLKSDTSSTDQWYLFGSFGSHKIGEIMLYNLIDLKTGKHHYRGMVRKKIPMLLPLPNEYITIKDKNEDKFFPSSKWEFSLGSDYFVKRGFYYSNKIVNENFNLSMNLTPIRPPGYSGGTGLTGIGKPEYTHYYFYPRLEAQGELIEDGISYNITGTFWYEHIFGKTWPPMWMKWNWWAIQLESGETFNLYFVNNVLKNKDVQSMITVQDSLGKTAVYKQFTYKSTRDWVSPKSKTNYPLEWIIEVPEWGYDLHINALHDDCEVSTLGNAYFWEGPCNVKAVDRLTGKIIKGKGTQELIGYGVAQMLGR